MAILDATVGVVLDFGAVVVDIVQLGPELQSSPQVLAQSKHYIQGGIHLPPPSTANFLKDSRHNGRLRFCTQASYMLIN